jgi:hypothetical protein
MPVGVAGGLAIAGAAAGAYGSYASNKANKAAAAANNLPYQELIGQAQGVAEQPFQAYNGPLTSGPTANENNAASLAGVRASQATQAFNQAATPFNEGALDQYESPFTNEVVNQGLKDLNENFNTQNEAAIRKQNMTDAFGYGRTAANLQPAFNAYQREAGDFIANQRDAAYKSALSEFNQQGAFQKGLGEAEGNAADNGVGALESTGKDIREANTAQDQAQYGEFLRGQNWSRQQIQPYIQAVTGAAPHIQQPTQSNVLTSAIGGALAGYGLGSGFSGGNNIGSEASALTNNVTDPALENYTTGALSGAEKNLEDAGAGALQDVAGTGPQ